MNIENASPRPWRIEHVTRKNVAFIKAANNEAVAVVNGDNAALIVKAVNEMEVK